MEIISDKSIKSLASSDLIGLRCKQCEIIFYRKVSGIKRFLNNPDHHIKYKFCSKSCAAKYNNKFTKKKKRKLVKCRLCENKAKLGSLYCPEHSFGQKPNWCDDCCKKITKHSLCDNHNIRYIPISEQTLSQIKTSKSAHPVIRDHARAVAKKNNINEKCAICGYNKAVEICHIKPIKEFNDNALVGEINSIDNLIGLCPNHHWELDHGLLDEDDMKKIKSGPNWI